MPIVDGARLLVADWGGNVQAIDSASGVVEWKQSIHTPNTEWPWHGFAGSGATDGETLYEASTEGVAYALDKKTGELRWQARFTEQPNAGNCGAVLVDDGALYIGVSSVEEGLSLQPGFVVAFIGEVVALNTNDGSELWRKRLTESPNTGVAVWSGFALDHGSGTLFFTTGNTDTGETTVLADSIVAVDAKTG